MGKLSYDNTAQENGWNINIDENINVEYRRYMAEILPTRRKTLYNHSINQAI